MTLAELRIDVVVLACAVSAGIHGALVSDHFEEGAGAGAGFVVATVLLAILAVVLTRSPSQFALVSTAVVFAGLIASYALVVTTGVPVLHPGTEPLGGLALFTKAVEAIGFVTAASALPRPSFSPSLNSKEHRHEPHTRRTPDSARAHGAGRRLQRPRRTRRQ